MKAQELPETFSANGLIKELKKSTNKPVYIYVVNEKNEDGDAGEIFEIKGISTNSEFTQIIIEDLK